ncbi:MAG: YceI family protein [Balneolaceae bacterium]
MSKVLQKILIPALCTVPILASAQTGKVQLSNESNLSINGKSNVNEFRCRYDHELQRDLLQYSYRYSDGSIRLEGLTLSLEVDEFDCGRKGINRDFRNTLLYEKYPFIHITLNELVLGEESDVVPTEALVTITIAGVKRVYTVPLNDFSSSEELILVGGNKILNMSDFGLTPPSPLMGLIKVSDELDIVFDLVITQN